MKYILKMVSEENLNMSLPHQNSVSYLVSPSTFLTQNGLLHSSVLTTAIHKTKSLCILNFMYPYLMVGHPRCVFINYIWLNQLLNTTNLWWIDVYYIVINYMFRRLWPFSG